MDKDFKLIENNKKLVRYLKLTLIVLLVVIEILIIAQYLTLYVEKGGVPQLVAVILSCFALAVLEAIDSFAIDNLAAKMVFYGLDSVMLLMLCIFTGNSYLSTLYCIVLTQFYISVDNFKKNIILFGVSCGLFIISFVSGWVVVNKGASLYQSIVQILGDCILGVFILAVHFAVTNFILIFYSKSIQLRHAVKQTAESKFELEEAYKQLSEKAVFEERNRIAKDIHDNAGHSMTAVIMQTEAAKLLIDTNPEEAKNRIISANMQAKNALDQMRESVHLLAGRSQTRPLREEIEEIIAQSIDGTELKIRCDLQDISVGEQEYRFICNSVKESIANGIRHGKATAFYIEMKKFASTVNILISDNGCGVDGTIKEAFGLRGMREKAESLGGKCTFSSEVDDGFEVEINLPVTE